MFRPGINFAQMGALPDPIRAATYAVQLHGSVEASIGLGKMPDARAKPGTHSSIAG